MKITRENYESFFLDYLDGNLEEQLTDEFLEFLGMNPDLKNELMQFEAISLPHDNSELATKQSLYRTDFEQPEIFEHTVVAWLEGDLPEKQTAELLEFVRNHPGAKKELEIFKITRLTADESVRFEQKEKLYRQPVIRQLVYRAMRYAAILLAIISIWSLWPEKTVDITPPHVFTELEPLSEKPQNFENQDIAIIEPTDPRATTPSGQVLATRTVQIAAGTRVEQPVTPSDAEETIPRMRDNAPLSILPARQAVVETSPAGTMLAAVNLPVVPENTEIEEELYLTDRLKQMAGLEGFSFSRLVRSGLELASGASNERFSYATNNEGDIVALSLDTRLLGLRIPVGKK